MSQFKNKEIIVVPTNKPMNENKFDLYVFHGKESYSIDLYVISNETIQKNDWFIELNLKGTRETSSNKPILCDIGNTGGFILTKNNGNFPFPENCRKIIGTTNLDIKLPKLSDDFINECIINYDKNSITNVLVEYDENDNLIVLNNFIQIKNI